MAKLSLVWSDTMMLQRCHNIEDEQYITTLLQHCKMTYHNIQTRFRQRCVNDGAQQWNPPRLQHLCNIVTASMLCQHWKLHKFHCFYNIVTTSPEHCVNVVGHPRYQHSHNIVPMLTKTLFSTFCRKVGTMLEEHVKNPKFNFPCKKNIRMTKSIHFDWEI